MRKSIITFALILFVAAVALAQTALPGKQEIEKTQLEGLYITSKVEDKYLEKYWEGLLNKYGKPTVARGGLLKAGGIYKLTSVKIPSISPDPINVISKVSSVKGVSQVFMNVDMGGGAIVTQGTRGYAEVDAFLKQFTIDAQLQDEARIAEEALKESEKNYQKAVSKGERLKKDIDKTTRELENLKKELETNAKDQNTAQNDLDTKKKVFDDTKMKLPKN